MKNKQKQKNEFYFRRQNDISQFFLGKKFKESFF